MYDEDDPKYAVVGKELIDRGLAQITEKGLLIYDPADKLAELYDGQTFPEYYYRDAPVCVETCYNGYSELLLLPDAELAIKKALVRLGAPSDMVCGIRFHVNSGELAAWERRLEGIARGEGLYEVNELLRALDSEAVDWNKLTAAVELAGAQKAADIAVIAERLDEFIFIPNAKDEADIAHFLVDNVADYEMNIDMEDYFDFDGFGEFFAEEHDGRFVSSGFICLESGGSMEEFLEELESDNEGMSMGVM